MAAACAEAAASQRLLAHILHEASAGLLLIDAAMCGCFGLSAPPACWLAQIWLPRWLSTSSTYHTQAQGNEALITRIITTFLRTTPPLLPDLRAAADAGRWATVASLAHHLRSNMQVLGIRAEAVCLVELQGLLPARPLPARLGLTMALRVLPSYLP